MHRPGVPLAPTALEMLLPDGVDRYVALLLAEPDVIAGTYVEVGDVDYARVAHDAWTTTDLGNNVAQRANNGAIVWASMGDADLLITHWAIFDDAFVGSILAWGPVRNLAGDVEPLFVATNDVPRFNSGALRLLTEET